MKYPKILVGEWVNGSGKEYKEAWWLIDSKYGLYLDTYSICVFGVGQEYTYSPDDKFRLPNKKEKLSLKRADLAYFYDGKCETSQKLNYKRFSEVLISQGFIKITPVSVSFIKMAGRKKK